jgi:predicted nucleic acid-binding protein
MVEVGRIKREYPVFPETPTVFPEWEYLVSKYRPKNRRIFDARLVALMLVHRIPEILSFNDKDFAQYSEIRVLNPFDVLGIPRL